MSGKYKAPPFVALVILLLVSLACRGGAIPSPVVTPTSPPSLGSREQPTSQAQALTADAQQSYKIGDIVSVGDYVLIVLGWENVPAGDFSKPDTGKKFVAIELLIVNRSQSAKIVSTLLQMSMKDDTGQKHDVNFMATIATASGGLDGELAPGEKIRGKIGFQIPESAQGLQFAFDASILGTDKVLIELSAEPVKVEPPARITGERTQQTYNVGDIIEMGTIILTVNEVHYPTGDQVNRPKAGFKFLVVDLTIENKSATALSISAYLRMSLKDPSGQKYNVNFTASTVADGGSLEGEISTNEKLRGQVGFQVPENAAGLVFVFSADTREVGKVFVTIP